MLQFICNRSVKFFIIDINYETSYEVRVDTVIVFHSASSEMTLDELLEPILLRRGERRGGSDIHKINPVVPAVDFHIGQGYVTHSRQTVVFDQKLEETGVDLVIGTGSCRRGEEFHLIGIGDKGVGDDLLQRGLRGKGAIERVHQVIYALVVVVFAGKLKESLCVAAWD